jgi:hypothetical protein
MVVAAGRNTEWSPVRPECESMIVTEPRSLRGNGHVQQDVLPCSVQAVSVRGRGKNNASDSNRKSTYNVRSTRWRSWVRRCATNRKVAGSIRGVTGIFQLLNLSGRIVAQRLTQPLNRNKYQEFYLGQRRPVRRADNLTTFMCRLSINSGASTTWNLKGLSRPLVGKLYLLRTILATTIPSESAQYKTAIMVAPRSFRSGSGYWIITVCPVQCCLQSRCLAQGSQFFRWSPCALWWVVGYTLRRNSVLSSRRPCASQNLICMFPSVYPPWNRQFVRNPPIHNLTGSRKNWTHP